MSNSKMRKTLGDWASGLHLMKKTHMSHGRKTGYMPWERGALGLLHGEQSYNEGSMLDIVLVILFILLNAYITVYYIYYYTYLYLYILFIYIIYITNYHHIIHLLNSIIILYTCVFHQKYREHWVKTGDNSCCCSVCDQTALRTSRSGIMAIKPQISVIFCIMAHKVFFDVFFNNKTKTETNKFEGEQA